MLLLLGCGDFCSPVSRAIIGMEISRWRKPVIAWWRLLVSLVVLLVFDYTLHHARIAAVMVLIFVVLFLVASPAFCVGLGVALRGWLWCRDEDRKTAPVSIRSGREVSGSSGSAYGFRVDPQAAIDSKA